jgi:hypothetical protein
VLLFCSRADSRWHGGGIRNRALAGCRGYPLKLAEKRLEMVETEGIRGVALCASRLFVHLHKNHIDACGYTG